MPGALLHITAGLTLFIIGKYYFKSYFNQEDKYRKLFLLAFVCVTFSIIPDIMLIIYYTTHLYTFCTFIPYHDSLHNIFFIISVIGLLFINFLSNIKNKPIWIMGMLALLLHTTMDLFVPDISMWI